MDVVKSRAAFFGHEIAVHTDASQSVGKVKVDVKEVCECDVILHFPLHRSWLSVGSGHDDHCWTQTLCTQRRWGTLCEEGNSGERVRKY